MGIDCSLYINDGNMITVINLDRAWVFNTVINKWFSEKELIDRIREDLNLADIVRNVQYNHYYKCFWQGYALALIENLASIVNLRVGIFDESSLLGTEVKDYKFLYNLNKNISYIPTYHIKNHEY